MHEKMKMMNMNTSRRPSLQIINTSTDVDCTKDVRFRRSFRSLVECMVPACCAFPTTLHHHPHHPNPNPTTSTTTVTATFFGHRRGHVSLCIQDHHHHHPHHPLLLLEFSIPTTTLAREMQHGLLRIALECDRPVKPSASGGGSAGLFDVPMWALYCNGKKAGFAVKRHVSEGDWRVLKMMRSVSVGAGVLPGEEEEMMYLRARFERVVGSVDSESFHMINPVGSSGQELSVFFMRS